jgi:hypothetical protein
LSIFLLLSVGISRLILVKFKIGGCRGGKKDKVDSNPACVEYLGAMACAQPAISQILTVKYHTGLQTMALVNTEVVLESLNILLVVTTMTIGLAILFATKDHLASVAVVWRQVIMYLTLTALALPTSVQAIPFLQRRSSFHPKNKTLQSLCVMTLALIHILQGAHMMLLIGTTTEQSSWIQVAESLVQAPVPSSSLAVKPILAFVVMDLLTMGLLHAFAWYYSLY